MSSCQLVNFSVKFTKWNTQVEFQLCSFFCSVANRSQVLNTHAWHFNSDICTMFWLMSTWHGAMAEEEKFLWHKISTDTVYNTLRTHTKYAHSVFNRPTIKDVEHFRNKSVHEPYKEFLYEQIFIYEWTFHRETCYINWAIQC